MIAEPEIRTNTGIPDKSYDPRRGALKCRKVLRRLSEIPHGGIGLEMQGTAL